MALFSRKKPEEVFTPRSATVNEDMYIDRSELETRLKDLVRGTKHIIIHGESGNGKTWLYKKVFSETRTPYAVVNLANAARSGSVAAAMKEKIARTNGDQKKLVQVISNSGGEFLPGGVGLKFDSQRVYDIASETRSRHLWTLLDRLEVRSRD